LHPRTLALLGILILIAAILQIFPFTDRSSGDRFVVAVTTEYGFPLTYATTGLESVKVNPVALLGNIAAVGAVIIALMFWMERWTQRFVSLCPRYELRPQTRILLVALILGGVLLEGLPFTNGYTDRERMNLPDNLPGNHWLGRGVPFAYYRVDSAESLEPRRLGMDAPSRIAFDSAILVFDFLFLALAIGETVYWFERRQHRLAAAGSVQCSLGAAMRAR
jgi:hypothetical protein